MFYPSNKLIDPIYIFDYIILFTEQKYGYIYIIIWIGLLVH